MLGKGFPLVWLALVVVVAMVGAVDWNSVKPMFLVSMYPPGDSPQARKHPKEPMVLDLETEAMRPEMLRGGVMAMERIFGGSPADTKSFPYQVGLLLQRPKGLYWCGGSLISDEYVLTAAHCVDMAKKALVFLGAHEIKNAKEPGQIRMRVTHNDFTIFPTWNPRRLKDDLAIVRLSDTVEFIDKIQPISLPKPSYEHRTFKDKLAIASGWGRYATGVHAISNVLRYVNLQVVDDSACKQSFPRSYRPTNICTSGRRARSTCNGDSGGPLVLRRKNSKKLVLIGVTSFGSIFGCDRGYPAAYTKVASYLDWIGDETGVEPLEESSSSSSSSSKNAVLLRNYFRDYRRKKLRKRNEPYVDPGEDTTLGQLGVQPIHQSLPWPGGRFRVPEEHIEELLRQW